MLILKNFLDPHCNPALKPLSYSKPTTFHTAAWFKPVQTHTKAHYFEKWIMLIVTSEGILLILNGRLSTCNRAWILNLELPGLRAALHIQLIVSQLLCAGSPGFIAKFMPRRAVSPGQAFGKRQKQKIFIMIISPDCAFVDTSNAASK